MTTKQKPNYLASGDAQLISQTIKEEAVKNRHKMKMMMLDIVVVIGVLFAATESFKAFMTYQIMPNPEMMAYQIGTTILAIVFGLVYFRSCITEKNCSVCRER
jgi:uncharacterized membrane protein